MIARTTRHVRMLSRLVTRFLRDGFRRQPNGEDDSACPSAPRTVARGRATASRISRWRVRGVLAAGAIRQRAHHGRRARGSSDVQALVAVARGGRRRRTWGLVAGRYQLRTDEQLRGFPSVGPTEGRGVPPEQPGRATTEGDQTSLRMTQPARPICLLDHRLSAA